MCLFLILRRVYFWKIAELEVEIVQYRKQRHKMSKLCEQHEQQMKSLENERAKLHEQTAAREKELHQWAEEQQRKLRREKKMFEKSRASAATVNSTARRFSVLFVQAAKACRCFPTNHDRLGLIDLCRICS